MRLALFSDIHANRAALLAVLADLAARGGADRIVILGDVVGYGPDPEWCAERVAVLVEKGAICLLGNHDAAVAGGDVEMNITAKRAMVWTRTQLSDAAKGFLSTLPLTARIDDMAFVHASANDPQDWLYVSSAERAWPSFRVSDARLIFCGHTHVPLLVSYEPSGRVTGLRIPQGRPVPLIRSRRWLSVVGSVGQPRDGVAAAAYALLDTDKNEITFLRVPYDMTDTLQKMRAAGLPESLAMRLERGV